MAEHECVDCGALPLDEQPKRSRPIVEWSGAPRCSTHLRGHKTRQRKQSRARQVERTYGVSADDIHELYLLQDGRCWLCRKATGATKSLAVDHDHLTGEVRGRLCGPCNQFIGHLGDSPEAAQRLVGYLTGDTPYRRLKAQQTLSVGFPDHRPVVHKIQQGDGELRAFWTHDGQGQNYATRVRTADGEWTTL